MWQNNLIKKHEMILSKRKEHTEKKNITPEFNYYINTPTSFQREITNNSEEAKTSCRWIMPHVILRPRDNSMHYQVYICPAANHFLR